MKVKICGITSVEDALLAASFGVDALGFVFHESSKRYLHPKKARDIVDSLPPFIQKVGVFTGDSRGMIDEIAGESGIGIAQLHDEILWEDSYRIPTLNVLRLQEASRLDLLPSGSYWLIDSFVDSFGGEGKRLCLDLFRERDCSYWILAGGLNAENIHEVASFGFYGVDVSSGVEKCPGVKDSEKMRSLIQYVKSL